MVEGYIEGDKLKKRWRSAPIESCENRRTLRSKTGGLYILVGPMGVTRGLQLDQNFISLILNFTLGFPKAIADEFTDGFPENWHYLISWLYKRVSKAPEIPLVACDVSDRKYNSAEQELCDKFQKMRTRSTPPRKQLVKTLDSSFEEIVKKNGRKKTLKRVHQPVNEHEIATKKIKKLGRSFYSSIVFAFLCQCI